MEPIKISSLPKQLVDLILSDPKRYNFNNGTIFDSQYLDEAEISVLLKTFNKKSPDELYKIGMDTFKSETEDAEKTMLENDSDTANMTDMNNAPAETSESAEENLEDNTTEEIKNTEDAEENKEAKTPVFGRILNMQKRDSASIDLMSIVSSDVYLNSPDNPLNPIYESSSSNNGMQFFLEEVAGETQKVEDELKDAEMTEESQFVYKDNNGNDKVINIRQAVSMGGIFQKEKNSKNAPADGGELEKPEDEDDNKLSGGIHYTLLANTENTNIGFKAHIDNTDQDFFTYVTHNKTLKNDGKLGFTGSGRVTLDQNEFKGSGGVAVDYNSKDNKISAGAYGHFTYESSDVENSHDYVAKGFVNFKEIGGVYARVEKSSIGYIAPYAGANLYGKKRFDNGVSIAGALSAEVGQANFDLQEEADKFKAISTNISARGSVSFQAGEDISANLDGMLLYERLNIIGEDSKPEHDLGGIIRGSFRKGKTEVYTVGCLYKDFGSENPLLTGAATFGIQVNDLIKKGLAAYVEGTVCNTKANANPDSSINGIKVGSRLNF